MIPERYGYDLSHKSVIPLNIGRLGSIARLAVLPADSFSGQVNVVARVSPMHRYLLTDLTYDIYWFFTPWRDYYEGKDLNSANAWKRFILSQGRNAGTSGLQRFLFNNDADRRYPYLMIGGGAFRHDIPWSYDRMYECFFEHPDISAHNMFGSPSAPLVKNYPKTGRDADTEASITPVLDTDKDLRWYGRRIMKLRTFETSLRQFKLSSSPTYAIQGNQIDLARLGYEGQKERRVAQQNLQNRRANLQSFMSQVFGVAPRDWNSAIPELLASERATARVSDVISQGDDRLGQKVSHAVAYFELRLPERTFMEHGWLWCVASLRSQPFFRDRGYVLDWNTNYEGLSGDQLFRGLGEGTFTRSMLMRSAGENTTLGYLPHYEEYRQHPNWVHPMFTEEQNTFLFDRTVPTTGKTSLKKTATTSSTPCSATSNSATLSSTAPSTYEAAVLSRPQTAKSSKKHRSLPTS